MKSKRMRCKLKLLAVLGLLMQVGLLHAEISVKSFRKLESDMTARIDAPLKDQNGDVCAIIKVVTAQSGFVWEPDGLGIVAAVPKTSEYWLYVPFGAKRLTIKHAQLGVLRDYMYPLPIEKAGVYEMVLVTGKVITTVEETIESQWLVITPEPKDASVYIDDVFVKSGMYQAKLKPGSYSYRIEAPLYHPEAGKLEITDSKKELNVQLLPAFGFIQINSAPENEATVIIDGKKQMSNTPFKSEPLASGEHTVQVMKDLYQPKAQKVMITDGQVTKVTLALQPNFAELTLAAPQESKLYVNNDYKGIGNWSGRLSAGVYSLEARMDKHKSAKQDIELSAGDKRKIDLHPIPIEGSMDIMTSPAGANIFINGKDYGTTPATINKLLIGDYNVQLSKRGYATVSKTVIVTADKTSVVNEKISNGRVISINSNPSGSTLYVDGKYIGITPYNGALAYGMHEIRATKNNLKEELNIELTENSESHIEMSLGVMINIDSDVKRCQLFVDGKYVGLTPYNGIFKLGSHTVDLVRDGVRFKQESLLVDGVQTTYSYEIKKDLKIEKLSGPGSALLSVLVPGLGDWNVSKGEKNGLSTMLWTYGLIGAGIGCKLYSNSEYAQYHLATDQSSMDDHYTNANNSNYAFYGLTALGVGIWVYDIIWVASKGVENVKQRKSFNNLTLIYNPSIQLVGLNYKIDF
jgi:hypothetical protein